jgi:hypothetical protein
MKKRPIAVGLLTSLLAIVPAKTYAEDCCLPDYLPGEVICDPCFIYGAYAGPQLDCGWNITAWAEFLYMNVTRTTAVTSITSPIGPDNIQEQFQQKFHFRPGFRIGIGKTLECFDDWTMSVNYIWYHNSFTDTHRPRAQSTIGTTRPYAPQTGVGAFGTGGLFTGVTIYGSVKDKTSIQYDVVSLNIQRPNYFGQTVILSPFLGVKWLHRNVNFAQELSQIGNDLVDRQNTRWKYSAIGIGAGLDGSWLWCWGFRLIGKADVALMYPYQRKLKEAMVSTAGPVINLKMTRPFLSLWGVGGMGLGWGSYLCCNRYYIDIAVTYDQMADVQKLLLHTGMYQEGAVVLYGLSVRGQFDF